jgi:spectinomycin phosphotransferase
VAGTFVVAGRLSQAANLVRHVLTPPSDLDSAVLVRALEHWGVHEPELEYLPVGFGSHHWRADAAGERWFVTVDDLEAGFQAEDAFDTLERAYRTAAALREIGLEFVLAPLADDEGTPIRRLSARYAVSVTAFVDGTSTSFGAYDSKDERRRRGELLGRLHAAGRRISAALPRRDELTIPSRQVLTDALASLDVPWESGPYADPARAVLAASADNLVRRLEEFDADATRLRARADSLVVTHGEPHRANVIVDTHDRLRLVDWDTTRLAPRERDLWLVLDDELTGWDEYASVVGDVSLDHEALELYGRWWDLADIAVFTADLRRPHVDDEQSKANFKSLRGYLAEPA